MPKFYVILCSVFSALVSAQSLQLYNPGNNVAYPDHQYFCAGESFNLKVDAAATSTGDYQIIKDQLSNFPLTAGSIPITFQTPNTNKFSDSFPIGFNFSFYGKTYTRAVLGSNGRLVFTNDPQRDNLKEVTTYTDRTFSGITGYNAFSALPSKDYNKIFRNNPTQELNLAHIFFGYTDLVPKSQNSSVTYLYKNINVGGVNGLLVSFQNMIRTNGTGGISSVAYYSYVLLLEDGRIVVYVNNKTESSYNAILGIQNDDATKFKVPVHSNSIYNYNNGPWTSEGVVWVFKPNQNLTPQFRWYRNTTLLPESANTLSNFVPNDGDILKVEVTYWDDLGNQVGNPETDSVTFHQLAKPVVTQTQPNCSTVILTTAAVPGIQYEWYQTGNPAILSVGNTFTASSNGNYFVRAKVPGSACFVDSDAAAVSVGGNFPNFNNSPKYLCKTDGSTSTTVNLFDYYPANPANYTLKFQENGVDIPNPANFVMNANTTRTVGIVANSVTSAACSFAATFDIVFASLPIPNTQYTANKLCFGEDYFVLNSFENQFFAGMNWQFTYSLDNGATFQNLTSVNPQTNNPILVKMKHPDFACETTVKLKFDFHPKVPVNPITPFPPHCFSTTEYFDLNSTKSELEFGPNIQVTFYKDAAMTDQITNLQYRGSGIVYIKILDSTIGCFSTTALTLVIYPKPTLIKTTPETKLPKSCGSTIYDLTTNINDYIGSWSHYSEIRYYDGNGVRMLNPAQWENYNTTVSGASPYMVFVYNQTNNLQCSDRINFDLKLLVKPVSQISQILICDELTYPLQTFKNAVISNSANYTFTDDLGNPLPTHFNLSLLPFTVKFLIKDNASGCISDVQTVTFVQGGNSVLLNLETDYMLCDDNFDGITVFNLDSRKLDFTNDPAAVFEYFKDAGFTQKINSNYTNEIPYAQTVYVRIALAGFCPANAQIHLKVNIPTLSSTLSDKYYLCYGDQITVDAGSENVQWEWSTGESSQKILISKVGAYSVKLTNSKGCSYTHQFIVSDENQPKITAVNQTNTSIEVIAEGGAKPYRYYFNGIPQNSNILLNPTATSYVIQVESATGCRSEPKTVYFIKIHNVFTPNSDGINDFWTIENLGKMQEVQVKVVDRFGQLVYDFSANSSTYNTSGSAGSGRDPVWDGKINGRPLPTSTYWYTITWFDPVTHRNEQRQGWLFLKNRD